MRRVVLLLLLAAPLLSEPARARDESDSTRARAALASGEVRPLAEIMARVEAHYAGRLIDTELERKRGRWIYEFKFLPEAGRIFKVEVDAATGAVLGTRGPVQEK